MAELMEQSHLSDWTDSCGVQDVKPDVDMEDIAEEIKQRHPYLREYIVRVWFDLRQYEFVEGRGWIKMVGAA